MGRGAWRPMQRKPNYDFERRERERVKAIKLAQKAEAKRVQRERDAPASDATAAPGSGRPPADD